MSHSPGPWKWKDEWSCPKAPGLKARALVAADGEPVLWDGEYNQGSCNGDDDDLIAAAPEMLGLLTKAAAAMEKFHTRDDGWELDEELSGIQQFLGRLK